MTSATRNNSPFFPRTQHKEPELKPKTFGELGNADYVVAQSEESMGLTGEKDALVIVDRGTDYTDCFPLMSRHASDAYGALKEFYGDVMCSKLNIKSMLD